MKRFAFILFLVFKMLSANAWQVDSLYNVLPNLEGKQKIDVLNKLAEQEPEKRADHAREASLLADKINYLKGKGIAAELLGDHAFETKDYENALEHYKQSNQIFTSLEDKEGQLRTLKRLNSSAFELEQYDAVIDYCLQLQDIAKIVGNKSYLAYSFARMGRIRGEKMKDNSGSREYTLKAVGLYLEIGEMDKLPALYSNLGITYFIDQMYDSTFIYLNKGIEVGKGFNQKKQLHILYSLSSELYFQKKEYDKALNYSKLALSLKNERLDLSSFDNLLIGKIYIAKEQFDTALAYVNTGIEKAKIIGDNEYLVIGYGHLNKIYQGKNELQKSIEYLEKLADLKDTISVNSLSLSLAEKEAEFQLQRKQQELDSLEKSAYQHRLFRNGILITSVLVIFILILFINRYNVILKFQKHELDRLRTIKQLEEKEKLLLKNKLLHKEKMLASNTMHIIQKNKILSDLKSEISNLSAAKTQDTFNVKIKNINRTIETNMTFESDWQKFKLQFEQVHPNFFTKLYKQFPGLSNNEIRFCSYIKMGHNTKEIAQLLGVNASSVQKARYRLKKKMELDKSTSLIDFITTV